MTCRCNCGYRCGGPGKCKDELCLMKDNGQHFVIDCDHQFEGALVEIGYGRLSVLCKKCGISAAGHDMLAGP